MNATSKILLKTLVQPFYREIAGALLFLFFVLFGIQQNMKGALEFHYYLVVTILKNPTALLIYFLVQLAYTLKCILFLKNQTQKRAYDFLKTLNATSYLQRILNAVLLAGFMHMPVICYSLIVIVISLQLSTYFSGAVVFALMLVLIIALALTFTFFLKQNRSVVIKKHFWQKFLRLRKNIVWFLGNYMFTKQIGSVIIVKVISFTALFYFVRHDEHIFDERMLWLIFLLSLIGHGVIIHKNFTFLENDMSFYRVMPLSKIYILFSLLLFYILICLPEMWALRGLGFLHQNWYSYLCMISAAPLILLLLHCLLYTDDMNMDSFLPLLFGIWLVFFFISFSTTKWLVPVVALIGSVIVFSTSFRTYERTNEVERLD